MLQNGLFQLIDGYRNEILKTAGKMVQIKAISPESGGEGEAERAEFLGQLLKEMGFEPRRYDYKDDHGSVRPNIIVKYGNEKATLWIIPHMDTVSEGDPSLWTHDPFTLYVEGDTLYGRGINDDGQDVLASIYALKALKESGAKLRYNYGLAIVADEELGSKYGISKLIEEGIFGKDDMFMVPDGGNHKGDEIEIAEKGILWLKISVHGKQVHASTPQMGVNAYRKAIEFLAEADKMLHSKYSIRNKVFQPDVSTFEMTKHEKNTDSVNIIPGLDVSYIDCRVLPDYRLDDIVADMKGLASRPEFSDTRIEIEVANQEDPTAPTSIDAEVVKLTIDSVRHVLGIEPKAVGIGGGTCASFFRKKGMPAVVWSKKFDIAHQPNEYALLSDILVDAKVFADMCAEK
ncbi:MAG: M20 family metallo-hydrolase [Candidatus Marsarchaeota archaeon]|nr:M20 family metallo-hydrolase [Candidatus Marsarchaeota archaeon]